MHACTVYTPVFMHNMCITTRVAMQMSVICSICLKETDARTWSDPSLPGSFKGTTAAPKNDTGLGGLCLTPVFWQWTV